MSTARGTVILRKQGRGSDARQVVVAAVWSAEGTMIWSDNSGAGAWASLLEDCRAVTAAARVMEDKGQLLEPWWAIVARAPKL